MLALTREREDKLEGINVTATLTLALVRRYGQLATFGLDSVSPLLASRNEAEGLREEVVCDRDVLIRQNWKYSRECRREGFSRFLDIARVRPPLFEPPASPGLVAPARQWQ